MSTRRLLLLSLCLILLAVGCDFPGRDGSPALPSEPAAQASVAAPSSSSEPGVATLSPDQTSTLASLKKVDAYPLYTMQFHGSYRQDASPNVGRPTPDTAWACSLFAALGDPDNPVYGRNFDWEMSPALLLFTDPPGGYASVSMVDIAYLGFGGASANIVADLPLDKRRSLLTAPFLPFEGMNEQGLAVGMAAVPPGEMRTDPSKETIGSLEVIRVMLDLAGNVDEAIGILREHNINMQGGTALHYLLADRSGRAALVEFSHGEMVVRQSKSAWHQATNFLLAEAESEAGQCWRYDEISRRLAESAGRLSVAQAMDLLQAVAQPSTQWSVVYGLRSGDIQVVMGRQYARAHHFSLAR